MSTQLISVGDCCEVFARIKDLGAIICDPPANVEFMGRKWDKAHPCPDYVPPIPARNKKLLRELQSEYAFKTYWGERYAIAYDACARDAVAIVWTLPRTQHQTADAMRYAGWHVYDCIHHAFGAGWPKAPALLAPGQEGWLIARKGKGALAPDLAWIPRGDQKPMIKTACKMWYGGTSGDGAPYTPNPNGGRAKNLILTHHAECLEAGVRGVKGRAVQELKRSPGKRGYGRTEKGTSLIMGYADENGLETTTAYHCAAGCRDCQRVWICAEGGAPSPCEQCGGPGQWLCPIAAMDEESGESASSASAGSPRLTTGSLVGSVCAKPRAIKPEGHSDSGGASRFFHRLHYCGKAHGRIGDDGVPRGERHLGCEELYWRADEDNTFGYAQITREEWELLPEQSLAPSQDTQRLTLRASGKVNERARGNVHPTVKPLQLMLHLTRLSGANRIGDICAGSGGGMIAAGLLGIDWVGCDISAEAVTIARARHAFWMGLTEAQRAEFLAMGTLPDEPVSTEDPRQMRMFE